MFANFKEQMKPLFKNVKRDLVREISGKLVKADPGVDTAVTNRQEVQGSFFFLVIVITLKGQ